MVLRPLEYSDCVHDSPFFRETLQAHEKELDNTAESIKVLVKACKRLLAAQKELSKAQAHVTDVLSNFKIELIGDSTEDEAQIIGAFKEFASLINGIEEQREMFLGNAENRLLDPLEQFRHEQVYATRDEKKTFDRNSTTYCKALENYLNTSSKRKEQQLQESDEQMALETGTFLQASCRYVQRLQDVQLRKKFDIVEPLLGFMRDQMTFYHHGYEAFQDYSGRFEALQIKLQLAREQYEQQSQQTEELINKIIDKAKAGDTSAGQLARQGYAFLQKPRKGGLGVQSIKHYCQYIKDDGLFVMFPYNQQQGKLSNPETFKLDSCTRRPTDSIERRFCFDVTSGDKTYTLQALNSKDRTLWMEVLDGREPDYMLIDSMRKGGDKGSGILPPATQLRFVEKCIAAVEAKGLEEEGVYRLSGVASKSEKMMKICIDRGKLNDKVNLLDAEWEVKTITSCLKNFFRNREALLTFKLYPEFLAAAKEASPNDRFRAITKCVSMLQTFNRKILIVLLQHLHRVSENAAVNKMHASNIGVVFGPTLMRPQEESVAGIMDIKYQNIVIEVMVERCEELFSSISDAPMSPGPSPSAASPTTGFVSQTSRPTQQAAAAAAHAPTTTPHQTLRRAAPVAPSRAPPPVPAPGQTASGPGGGGGGGGGGNGPPPPPRKPAPVRRVSEGGDQRGRAGSDQLRQPNKPPPPPPSVARHRTNPSLTKATAQPTSPPATLTTTSSGQSTESSKPVAPVPPRPRRRPVSIIDPPTPGEGPDVLGRTSSPADKSPFLEDSGKSGPPAAPPRRNRTGKRARALYPCIAEDDNELTFVVDDIFNDVVASDEPGWFVCNLRGKSGLVPENYIEFL